MGKSRNSSAYRKKTSRASGNGGNYPPRKKPAMTPRTKRPLTLEEQLFRAAHMHQYGYHEDAREALLWLIVEVVKE